MSNFYTSKIITPSLSSFHDIPGIPSLQQWMDQSVPDFNIKDVQKGPEYPYYSKTPLPVFNNFQYAFAPNAKFSFFGYGTEFLNTTAFYEIYDEFSQNTIFRAQKYIPPYVIEETPPTQIAIASIANASFFASEWYLTVHRQPLETQDMKTASYVLKTIVINEVLHQSIFNLDITNNVPEIQFTGSYNNSTDTLTIYANINLFTTQDATYNFVANKIDPTSNQDFVTTSYFVCSLASSDSVYTIPATATRGGKVYTFIHNGTYGGLVETRFAKGTQLAQGSIGLFIPGTSPGLNVVITETDQVSCILPDPGPWSVSGVFIDMLGNNSISPKISFETQNINTATLIDTITAYDGADYSIYGEFVNNSGSIATKYDYIINSGDYIENRTIYLNWYKSNINQTEYTTTNSTASSIMFAISAVSKTGSYDSPIDIYAVPVNNSNNWNVSGYKTEINYVDRDSAVNDPVTQTDVLSGSWTGAMYATGAAIGQIKTILIDQIYYYQDAQAAISEGRSILETPNNYGGVWELILAIPGGELLVKKNIVAVWSDPETSQINYQDETSVVLDINNQYPTLSAGLNLFATYDGQSPGAPVSIGVRSNFPLEAYGCRYLFSSSDQHLLNTTKTIPITSQINGSDFVADSYTTTAQFRPGAKYDVLIRNTSDPTDIAIYTHQQLAVANQITGFTFPKISLTTFPSVAIDSAIVGTSANFQISSSGDSYYVAGYKTYNNSTTFAPIFTSDINAFTRTVEVSSFDLDSESVFEGYDTMWGVTIRDYNRTSLKIQNLQAVYNNTGGLSTKTTTIVSDTVNSNLLSSVNCFSQQIDDTIVLSVTADNTDIYNLSSVELFIYKTGITSPYCIRDQIESFTPSVPEAEVDYIFTYPGTYTVKVSAVSGLNNTVVSVLTSYDNYFKIIDIPPLVNFDITNESPVLANYTALQGSSSTNLSYYKSNVNYNTLTAYDVYINTWSTAPGSFGIEAIWIDYGDGSQIEKINKTRDVSTNPSTLAFFNVQNDPRNHVFRHTYTIPDYAEYTYNVSITAFSQNTNAASTGYKTISSFGPAQQTKKYLLSNSIQDDGSVIYNIQIDGESSKYLSNPINVSSIQYLDSRYYSISV